MPPNIAEKVVLITGASAGIGRELAIILAGKGYHVLLAARSGDKLHAIAEDIRTRGGKADHFVVDLTDETATDSLISEIKQKYPYIDVLINNAGTGWYGYFEQLPWKAARDLIDLNITVLVKLTRAFIPQMRLRSNGHIINISSIVGDLPAQGAVLYSSTKAFVNSFTKAISRELNGSGIKVSLVKPGPVSTGFYDRAEENNGQRIPGERFAISVEKAAQLIANIVDHPRRVTYVPWYYFFMPWIDRLFGPIIQRLGPILLGHAIERNKQSVP
jgi:uncharacterized protein